MSSNLTRRGGLLLIGFLIFIITALTFLPSLHDSFVKWDDDMTFYENPHLQNLGAANLRWIFTNVDYSMRYKPLSWLAYALINSAVGMNPHYFHALALLFHSMNAVLFFIILRKLLEIGFKEQNSIPALVITAASAIAALLWSVNPLRVEPVARATDLTYSQSLFFVLISLYCYLRAASSHGGEVKWNVWRIGAIAAFALSMLSYPFIFAYSLVLIVLDFYPLRRFGRFPRSWRDSRARPMWIEKIPFLVLSGIILATFAGRLNPSGYWARTSDLGNLTLGGKIIQAFYVWAYELWKPWLPFHLAPIYTTLVSFNPRSWPFLANVVVVAGISAFFFWRRKTWPMGLALWTCYLVLLIPALGLTEHPHYLSDRYSYVAGMFWPILIAAGCVKLSHNRAAFLAAMGALLVLTAAWGAESLRQVRIWRNSPALFDYVLHELGNDPYRANIYMFYGTYYLEAGDNDQAIEKYNSAIEARPNFPTVLNFLGIAQMQLGRFDDAAASFRQALKWNPNFANARVNLDSALLNEKKTDEVISHLRVLLKEKPDNAEAHNELAVALDENGQSNAAINELKIAIQLKPDYTAAINNLAAFQKQKDPVQVLPAKSP